MPNCRRTLCLLGRYASVCLRTLHSVSGKGAAEACECAIAGTYAEALPLAHSSTLCCSYAAFEALYVFLQPEQTAILLYQGHLPVLKLEVCMQQLEGQLAAQMTAVACLCKLALMELQEEVDTDTSHAYCGQVLAYKGFKAMMRCLEAGIQVWSCVCCQARP